MRKITILIIISIVIGLGFLSGCTEPSSNEMSNKSPTASFSYTQVSASDPLSISFTGAGTDPDGQIISYYWDFGDGTTASIKNPSHRYQDIGSYKVTFTVTDNGGKSISDEKTISIEEYNEQPIATASADKTSGAVPLVVSFSGSGTDTDGSIVSYNWKFGDGYSSNEQNPTHTYTKSGTYSAIFTVTDNKGGIGVKTISINVNPESEQSYKLSCRNDITYDQLNSNANNYIGQRVTYIGTILQVVSASNIFRIDVGSSDVIYVTIDKNVNVIEDDPVQFWGEVKGYYTYTSTAGYEITIPKVQAIYIEKASLIYNVGQTAIWTGLEVTVISAAQSDHYEWTGYSDTVYTEYATSGNTFIIINVKVKQTGSDSEYVSAGDFWLVDSEGNVYEYDSGTYSINGGLEGKTIYQNQQTSGKILYEVPDSISHFKLQYNFGTSYSPILVEWNINI